MSLDNSYKDGEIFLSLVIPCYNEETVIEDTLRRVIEYLRGQEYSSEIIVIDDGSQDNTRKIVRNLTKEFEEIQILEGEVNKGKGFSVSKGLLHATGQVACFTDADLSTPIEEVEKLIKELNNGYDIAIGSRGLKESDIRKHQPWYRERMGKTFNLLIRWLVLAGIKDTQCGFKCFNKKIIPEIIGKQRVYGFSFDVEMLYIAKKLGYKIKEVPIRWHNNPHSKVNPFTEPIKMLLDILRIKINDWKGKY